MGTSGIFKGEDKKEQKFYLTKCNDCERDVRLSSDYVITPEQIEELQKRMLCHACLNKKLEAKK